MGNTSTTVRVTATEPDQASRAASGPIQHPHRGCIRRCRAFFKSEYDVLKKCQNCKHGVDRPTKPRTRSAPARSFGQHGESLDAVDDRSLQSGASTSHQEPLDAVIPRQSRSLSSPPRPHSPPRSVRVLHPEASRARTIPPSAYLSCPHRNHLCHTPYMLPAHLSQIKRRWHTKALFHTDVARQARRSPFSDNRTSDSRLWNTSGVIPLLPQTRSRPGIVLTGPRHSHPTMCCHTWEDLGGEAYEGYEVVVAIPVFGWKGTMRRGCGGCRADRLGGCEACYFVAWMNYEAMRVFGAAGVRPAVQAKREVAESEESESSDSEESDSSVESDSDEGGGGKESDDGVDLIALLRGDHWVF